MKLQTLKPRLAAIATQRVQPQEVDRLRGRAAVKRRADWLDRHPLCAECEKHGRVSAATVPDHEVPLWAGGLDDLEVNGRSLCTEDHDTKTACEARMRSAGGWLASPCICGQHPNGDQR